MNDDEDEGYDYPQLEVEHDEMHGLWWHSLSAKAIEVSFQADMKFWYIEPKRLQYYSCFYFPDMHNIVCKAPGVGIVLT